MKKRSFRLATAFSFILAFATATLQAQCPTNIGFEDGTFTGWTCYTGTVANSGTSNIINLTALPGPVAGRHTMYSAVPGDGNDEYGDFPKNCPNGSGHSIKLGNNAGGSQAEGVSYQLTIPATANQYSLIYYYAVVFQDPGHATYQQPRLDIVIENLTDGTAVNCSNFAFIASSSLPGFFQSPRPNGSIPVWCKGWSANSVNLDGNAGKTIRLTFKTADCTFNAHFGYAYVDVSTECSSSFVGANYCPDDTAVNIRAPYGYQGYTWFNSNFTQVLGTTQVLRLAPPPPPGTTLNVELTPFNGYGCKDTLTARLIDTLSVQAHAGRDLSACQNSTVQLGEAPKEGLVYSWSPTVGLSNPNISNPTASPSATTTYVLSVRNQGGGCLTTDTVVVTTSNLNNTLTVVGSANYCVGSAQSSKLHVNPADSIQWYKDGTALPGERDTLLTITQTGAYFAKVFSLSSGCSLTTNVQQVNVYSNPVPNFTTNTITQCFTGHQYTFTSTAAPAGITYLWDFGDATTASTSGVNHTYLQPGNYPVKLIVTGAGGCKDSLTTVVLLNPSVKAGFTYNSSTQCFKNHQFTFTDTSKVTSGTIQHRWDMGNGTIFTTRNITAYSYPVPGTYNVIMATTANGGCSDTARLTVTVNPSATASFTVNNATQCFNSNQFAFTNTSTTTSGTPTYTWDLGDATTVQTTQDISYQYAEAGAYTVKLLVTAVGGCQDSSKLLVSIYPTPKADFTASKLICTDVPVAFVNKIVNTSAFPINYLWDFGNGATSTDKTPVYSYPVAGSYIIKLSVSTTQCPSTANMLQQTIIVEAPVPGITYADKDAIFNFREQLDARPIGTSAIWTPATNLDKPNSYHPVFLGLTPQLYTVELRTPFGCITVDTQLVKTHKKIDIYVPSAFTPGTDGKNDYLRPILMSFEKINYFKIYNRFGQLLYSATTDRPGWNGRIKGELADIQTVVWVIEAVDVDGKTHIKKGTTLLLR